MFMKKGFILVGILILAACGTNDLIHSEYQQDIDQVLEMTDKAYAEKRKLTDDEFDLIDAFEDKYEVGKFITEDNQEYEMNIAEKMIAQNIGHLQSFTVPEDTLASEKDYYTKLRDETANYLNLKEIPEEMTNVKDLYPTYEIYSGVHPKMAEEAKELIELFDPIVNGDVDELDSTLVDKLDIFLSKYEKLNFEHEDKLYHLNDESFSVMATFSELKKDITSGGLTTYTAGRFNETKNELGI